MNSKKEYNSVAHTFLRAEAFCAEMIANGLSFNEIRVILNSNFKKSFRNEIDEVRFNLNEDTNVQEMELVINRDGIYDRLPEGLFHQSKGNSKTSTTAQMTEEYRRFRDEEKMARKFFQPYEQEFFRYATLVEQEELNLAFGILNGDLKSELFNFWEIPNELPDEPAKKLVQIMPWVKNIKGDIEQTAKALEFILDKPIEYEAVEKYDHLVAEPVNSLNLTELGVDTVIGSNFWEPSLSWKFKIEHVKKNEIKDYRPNGPYGKLLKQFEEIFIPLQIDIIFDYAVLPAEDFETEDILGFSLTI
jgi:DNA-binding transcriptional regulator YiaG